MDPVSPTGIKASFGLYVSGLTRIFVGAEMIGYTSHDHRGGGLLKKLVIFQICKSDPIDCQFVQHLVTRA